MQIRFQIYRCLSDSRPFFQTYDLEISPGKTVLDCLNQIKWEMDGSLAFRKNCRNTICGSCAMHINGRSALACQQTVEMELKRLATPQSLSLQETDTTTLPLLEIRPLPNLPVLKDLVVDMSRFWQNLAQVKPSINVVKSTIPEREFLQSPGERTELDPMGNCILCGACYAECNAQVTIPEFVGPHALAKTNRLLIDSRDVQTTERLQQANTGFQGVWGCTRCLNCNAVCPMGVAPLDQIHRIKHRILENVQESKVKETRPIRHRLVMLKLVAQNGWIDERQFGLRVVGDNFRDLAGIWSLVPLGLNMLTKGKFPFHFEPSEGTQSIRSLLNSIKMQESKLISPSTVSISNPLPPEETPKETVPNTAASPEPGFGWTEYAEKINGRFAMIGFLALMLLEWFTHQDFFTWLGLR